MTSQKRFLFVVLTWLAMLIIPLPVVLLLNQGVIDTPAHLLAYDCGVYAYVWWLLIVFLSTRPRWLMQRLGVSTLYGVHGGLGVMALIAATLHRFTTFSMFPLIRITGIVAWYVEIFLVVDAVLFLSGWLVDRLHSVRRVKQWVEHHFLNHEVTMWIHRLNFVAIALIWLHVNLIPRLRNAPGFIMIFNVYTSVALLGYCWWKLRQMVHQPRGTVVDNKVLANTSQELTVHLNDGSSYRAGDFYFLSFRGVEGISAEPHPFSVASAPGQSPTLVKFIIQQRGDFTRQLPLISRGINVNLEGPFGLFDSELRQSTGPVVLYGLGTGVAPLLGLARQYAGRRHILLLWSGAEVNHPDYQEVLSRLEMLGVRVVTQLHRFTPRQLSIIISARQVKTGQVIIVGSAAKVLRVRRLLRQRGFHRGQLHDERITL